MKGTEQGVRKNSRRCLLYPVLLLALLILAIPLQVGASRAETDSDADTAVPVVSIVFSDRSKLQTDISLALLQQLTDARSPAQPLQIRLIHADSADAKEPGETRNSDLVISLGSENVNYAKSLFPPTPVIAIVSNPGKQVPGNTRDKPAILYMTQPFCRQLSLIHLLNPNWRRVSYLTSRADYPDEKSFRRCASMFQLEAYRQYNDDPEFLSADLRTALHNSDLLLALPDGNIYNRKTVKNILLTSYRMRKPVIAFSENFVNAGAIAAIHSSSQQIAQTASRLVYDYFSSGRKLNWHKAWPDDFDISINRQVFRALNLPLPDTGKIKKQIMQSGKANADAAGDAQ